MIPYCTLAATLLNMIISRSIHVAVNSIIPFFLWLYGRDWGQEEKGTTEDEIAGWHHRLDEHEFE